jgi:hypothetical protein
VLDEQLLVHGLNALSRAHRTDYFTDGHRGAAILSAYFLCSDTEMEDGAIDIVWGLVEKEWFHSPLCAPFPDERPDPALAGRIAECLRSNIDGLRQAGHNVIFPSLALKALQRLPQAATPSRVDGICKLVESFTIVDDLRLDAGDDIRPLGSAPAASEFILSELPKSVSVFEGRGQGWSGHLLTYGAAILDLREIGYTDLAEAAEHAFRIYIKRIRLGPLDTDGKWPEHPASDDLPNERRFWQRRSTREIGLGHLFKYPYGYSKLMGLAGDTHVRQACREIAHRVL